MTGSPLAPGDTVVLKSGGPLMTVLYTNAGYGERDLLCSWFLENGERRTDVFPPESLKRARDS